MRYYLAIILESEISLPVIKSAIVVLKLKMMSNMNNASISSLKDIKPLSLNDYGSKATSRGAVKHTHKPKAMMIKSQ